MGLVSALDLAERRFEDCSQGERQRLLLARALMADPRLLLLDEPASGLDLPGREGLVAALVSLARDRPALPTVTVTHHLEEIAPSTTHALLLRGGRVLAAGPVAEVLTQRARERLLRRARRGQRPPRPLGRGGAALTRARPPRAPPARRGGVVSPALANVSSPSTASTAHHVALAEAALEDPSASWSTRRFWITRLSGRAP